MKKSGLTRRIDELGRIVIPKEIRKNLKIRDSDELEISVRDGNIILNKYEVIEKDKTVDVLLKTISKITKKNILFTSKDKIVDYSMEDKSKITDLELSNSIIKILENRQQVSNDFNKICITKNILDISYLIHPIIINGDLLGSLILYSEKEEINEFDRKIIDFSNLFLEKYLE